MLDTEATLLKVDLIKKKETLQKKVKKINFHYQIFLFFYMWKS